MSWFSQTNLNPRGSYQDSSLAYTNNKKVKLYIFDNNSKRVLVFKPFIDSLSYAFEYTTLSNLSSNERIFGNQDSVDGFNVKISLGINLLASSIEEAKLNLSKVNELTRMQKSFIDTSATTSIKKEYTDNVFGVYLLNLISNGNTYKGNLTNHSVGFKNFLYGYISDFKFDMSSKELGFFDRKRKLYPKQIKISFDFIVSYAANYLLNKKDIFLPFQKNGKYYSTDVKHWPFSISKAPINHDYQYSSNKNSFVTFSNDNCPSKKIRFNLFLDSLSSTMTRKGKNNAKYGSTFYSALNYSSTSYAFDFGFDVPAKDLAEAESNMSKIQQLIRIINNFNTKIKGAKRDSSTGLLVLTGVGITKNRILLSNLINAGKSTSPSTVNENGVLCMVKQITFEPNLDMGMFDSRGMLLFKSFKLGFKCEAVKDEADPKNPLKLRYPKGFLNSKKTKESSYKIRDNKNPPQDFILVEDHDKIIGIKTSKAVPEQVEPEPKEEKTNQEKNKDEEKKEQQSTSPNQDQSKQEKPPVIILDTSDW